jgi:hypothetical protein
MSAEKLMNVKKFVYDFRINVEKVEERPVYSYRTISDYHNYDKFLDAQVYQQTETMYKLEIGERQLEQIVEIVNEWQDLMANPQSADLLMEARFINRLQRGI